MNIETDKHYAIGPQMQMGDHGGMMVMHDEDADHVLYFCTNCGYVTDDARRFIVRPCDREDNPIPVTLLESGGL